MLYFRSAPDLSNAGHVLIVPRSISGHYLVILSNASPCYIAIVRDRTGLLLVGSHYPVMPSLPLKSRIGLKDGYLAVGL